ncbi:MAG: hypothetical protein COA97_04700 [Flavobacteriales bacterium]|nr:MAG: hypothetical protein COA97_04700 [Flavobacteriales bacterium]
MKSTANIFITILLLWMCGSAYYYVTNIKGFTNEPKNTFSTTSNVGKTISDVEIIEEEVVSELKEEEEETVPAEEEISMDNKTIYFGFGLNNLTIDSDLKTYISELNTFLQKHTDQNIVLIGHTDTTGSESINNLMGLERAKFVKNILVEAGIDGSQIKTESKGEKEASSTSVTREGQSTDRKVEIITK